MSRKRERDKPTTALAAALAGRRVEKPKGACEVEPPHVPEAFREVMGEARPMVPPRSRRVPPPARSEAGVVPRAERPVFDVTIDADGHVEGARAGVPHETIEALRLAVIGEGATLDLHGVRASKVPKLVQGFLSAMKKAGVRAALIVHGKGLHSEGGTSVLRATTVEALSEGRSAVLVRAFVSARPSLGGTGALVVELTVG